MKPKQNQEKPLACRRGQERNAMLEEALARPGVREVMEVYAQWQRRDQGLESYRAATKEAFWINTTDNTNTR